MKDNFKGTPGPWDIAESKEQGVWFTITGDLGCERVCEFTINTPSSTVIHNAALIAAAPEMLAHIIKDMEWQLNDGIMEYNSDRHKAVLSIVAKATTV